MKKIILIGILSFILILAMSCGVFATYEDTNGNDDYTLQSITMEMLLNKDSALEVGSISSKDTKNGVTSLLLNVTKFDGVKMLNRFSKGSYTLLVSFKVRAGNTRLVLTDGKKIIYDFLINEENQVYEFTCDSPYYLKIAGESCEFDLQVKIEKK